MKPISSSNNSISEIESVKKIPFGKLLVASAAAICMTSPIALTHAQEEDTEVVEDEEAVLNTVVVSTARRRSENVQDIPDQVQVFSDATITDAGVDSLTDLSALSPGLYFSGDQFPGLSVLSLRGVSQLINSDAPVAYAVDGVTYANSLLFSQPLFDIQQVEVLRGPQGALYGRNSVGGAINITTKAPSDEFELIARARAGEGNDFAAQIVASGPIVEDVLRYRLTFSQEDREGLFFNEVAQQYNDSRTATLGRLKLLFTPTSDLSVDLRASGMTSELQATRYRAVDVPTEFTQLDGTTVPFPPNDGLPADGILQQPFLPDVTNEWYSFSGKVDYDFDWGRLTSITDFTATRLAGVTWLQNHRLSDLAGEIAPEDSDAFTQEVRLTSNDDNRLRWIIGGFYQDTERERSINIFSGACCTGNPDANFLFNIPDMQENTVTAGFFQLNYDINDWIELTVAGRYDQDERRQITAGREETFDAFQPKVSLAVKPNDDVTLYGTYSEGFRAGGFNATDDFAFQYDQETLKNYEIGAKTTWFDKSLTLNGAVYFLDYQDQQYFLFTPAGGQSILNAEESSVFGAELELIAEPLPGLDLVAGLSYQDTEVEEYGDFPIFVGTPFENNTQNFNGNQFVFTPEYNLNLSGQYTAPLNDSLTLVSRVDFERRGRTFFGIDNVANDDESQAPVSLVNLRLSLEQDDNMRYTFFLNNAFDEDYKVHGFVGRFVGQAAGNVTDGNPQHWGFEVEYRF